jgi:hypothetical protein
MTKVIAEVLDFDAQVPIGFHMEDKFCQLDQIGNWKTVRGVRLEKLSSEYRKKLSKRGSKSIQGKVEGYSSLFMEYDK